MALTIITKRSILDVEAVLDPPVLDLNQNKHCTKNEVFH